jgi:2-methylcitrate dehydratase PrpD
VARELAEWVAGLRLDDVPPAVRHAACRHLLDGLGTALAAARRRAAEPAVAVATGLGGPPEATVLGSGTRISAPAAALANGTLVHALDFDDTHAVGLVHATAAVLPAALAVGEQVGASGEEVLTAAVAGYEVVCRLAAAAPHAFHARGLHATSVCGVLAAAAVTGRLSGLDTDRLTDALGIAGSSAGGLLEFLHTGAATKQLHPGLAGSAGILAARLAAAGATGPDTVLEGGYGLYAALAGRPDADAASVLDGLGERWETTCITVKPYPACQLLHAALDAARRLPRRDPVAVVADLHPDAVPIVAEPRAAKLRPRTPYEAKFSLPWSVAAMLVDGRVGLDTYAPDRLHRSELAALAERVTVRVVPAPGPAADAPGRVAAALRDGSEVVGEVPCSSGGPASPLSDGDLVAKAVTNVGGASPAADDLVHATLDLADQADLGALLAAATTLGETP